MANTAGGNYHAQGGSRAQFPTYTAGGYYTQAHQQQSQGYQYYSHPGVTGFGGPTQVPPLSTPNPFAYNQQQAPTLLARNPPPPPPPPPPPGETKELSPMKNVNALLGNAVTSAGGGGSVNKFLFKSMPATTSLTSSSGGGYVPPLQPPPLPPMFPWMSPALAESMTSSQFGKNFREEASNLPFVPIIVNDADLAKMTENLIKEAEQVKSYQLQYYKDVVNQDLPQPLKDMFQPLYCKLCTLTLSSPTVAKDHYSGRRHKKGIEAWFQKNPHYNTVKHKHEGISSGMGASFQQQLTPGTVVKTPGGGLGLTGPINGFITKQNNSNQHKSGNSNTHSETSGTAPPSLFSLNLENSNSNRKRPAAPPPPSEVFTPARVSMAVPTTTASDVNSTQQKQYLQNQVKPFIGPQRPSDTTSATVSKQATPPPVLSPTTSTNATISGTNNLKPTLNPKFQNNCPPSSASYVSGWQGALGNTANNPDFEAKRPRRDEDIKVENMSGTQQRLPATLIGGDIHLPPREKTGGGPPPKEMCEICNVHLSSKVMAEQHFKGKNHQAKIAALKDVPVSTPSPSTVSTTKAEQDNSFPTQSSSGLLSTNNDSGNIVNKLLALSSQSSVSAMSPVDNVGNNSSYSSTGGGNSFHNQKFQNNSSRGAGLGGFRGGGRGGGGGGRGNHQGSRGGGHINNNQNNRGGGSGGGGGRGGRGGGPPFRFNNNSNNNNNNNNFNTSSTNNNSRFNNNNNRGRGR